MRSKENFLDYIPRHNILFPFQENEEGLVEVQIENKGVWNRILQHFANKPRYTYITLEGMGSFIWKNIDGVRTVYEIGQMVKDEYGKDAEPLYERLCPYIQKLHQMRFIVYENKMKKKSDILKA
ncbi:MAG: PqqD family protein [Acetatifactor sp.]|nr:PqqD family protein [Acetatifactor sp.]